MRKKRVSKFSVFNYTFFVILGLVMLYPFWYVVMYSVSDPSRTSLSDLYLIPNGLSFETYKFALQKSTLLTGFRNTVFLAVAGTGLDMAFSILLAYPLSQEEFPGKKYVHAFIIFPMLFGGGMIPTYLVVKQLGLIDSLWSLVFVSLVNVYNLLILCKFFKGIPQSLIEAARIDGCGELRILTRIVLPLSKAALATISLFYAVQHWNGFLEATIYINTDSRWPLQVVLRNIIQMVSADLSGGETLFMNPENFKMAAIVITVLPIICVYPFLQKHFTQGVMLGAVKG
ncbi:carbohydrate ABC transporter permease [Hungatella hathewayi]|uniref:carbohydrate ABC transporter permease n=1 Tax=Hungatella hathewayi TaxID=154046 RepID=UPI003567E1FA